ncbi:A-kinase anchor protein 9 isoform X2 [Thamnophis elegans]|uniref:A-kinase anchor protein 9 isoform X2 n=1 Tax=Thamnophis elegans TaxID=35005 RepID=UPI00137832BD|nr:A-kinase anchor protein 9 isoform X2 [Thamnophis elegans]
MDEEERQRKTAMDRSLVAKYRRNAEPMDEEERQRKIAMGRAVVAKYRRNAKPMDEEERQRKIAMGRAVVAKYRRQQAYAEQQNALKKKKNIKVKDEELIQEGLNINQLQTEEVSLHSFQREAAATSATSESITVRTLPSDEMIKHDQIYTTKLENDISTPEDYSSAEEELEFGKKYIDHEVQNTVTELMNELAGKQQEIEELNKKLEEMRTTYGTDELQQFQQYEEAIKKRDSIIIQLTANLQQARIEREETVSEFLDLTEQTEKLQIQFQHLQASETLRNNSYSSTAADLLQARQQIFACQQQLKEKEQLLKNYQKINEDLGVQVSLLQHKIMGMEKWKDEEDCSTKKKMHEQQTTIEELKEKCKEHEENMRLCLKKLSFAEKSLVELKEETFQKNQELRNVKLELTISKQKEKECSEEIKLLMGTVEKLQKQFHEVTQHENDIKEKMEFEAQRKVADLTAELEEMHGQQIVQLKQVLIREHSAEIEKVLAQQKADLEKVYSDNTNDQIHLMNTAINDLNQMLQDAYNQQEKVKHELSKQVERLSLEKSSFQNQVEDLCQQLSFARFMTKKAISEKETKLQEVDTLKITIGHLKAQLISAVEIRKELEMKHVEIINYQIKLEMLGREKDAVLDRMAESQEEELERLRTQLLFSHEEELSKVKDDLQIEHKINIENLKDNMTMQAKHQLDDLQNEMNKKLEAMQFKNDNLIKIQNQLTLEIARLEDLHPPTVNTNSEEMILLIKNLKEEIKVLRQEEKKKCILEQELQLKTELLDKKMKEQAHYLQEKYLLVEAQNDVLEGENKALQDKLNKCTVRNVEGNLIFTSNNSNSEDFDLQNRIDKLIAENEKLVQQDIKQKEEINTLKNSFSRAEINFNHNYQELKENYTSLLKVKLDLEASMDKNKEEYIEKDTSELMEKLELSQHENLELSLRLSDLSEQLKVKHHQICQLNAEVMCLKQDKEHISARCKELEFVVSHKLEKNINSFEQETENCRGELAKDQPTVNEPGNFISDFNQKFDISIEKEENIILYYIIPSELLAHSIPVEDILYQKLSREPESLLDNFNQMHEITGDSVCMNPMQKKNKVKEQLDMLKTKQSDLKLQMEAQSICPSVVYSAHVNQVRDYMEKEKENALSAFKEDLQLSHTQEFYELNKGQIVDNQKTDEKDQSAWVHLEELSKKVVEECSKLTKSVREILPELFSNATELDVGERNQSNSALMPTEDPQVLQETLQSLLNNIMETSQRLLEYQVEFIESRIKMEDQQTSHVDYNDKETGSLQQNVESLPTASQDLVGIKVKSVSQEEVENLQFKLEQQHAKEIGHLRSYFLQQLKETEEKYFKEIVHLENRLQIASESSENSSVSVESHINEDKQEPRHAESDIRKNTEKIIEFSKEAAELLEKQYQEKMLQEVAKVVVTMSIEFAQKTEQTRIANLKEEEISLMKPTETQLENNSYRKEYPEKLICHINEKTCTKPEKVCDKMLSLEGQFEFDAKQATLHEVQQFNPKISTYSSSHDEEFIEKMPMITNAVSTSSTIPSTQMLSYENRLEEMRQELVRQYQEHQQATEILKQSHMQQMERQKENQELLVTELDSLKIQLAENISENATTAREQLLLDELESLKKQLIAGREKQLSELKNSSTQTQNESVNQTENKEHVLEVEDGEEKHEQMSLNILSKERCTLQKANNRLMRILLDIAKTTAAVEETIGHLVVKLIDQLPKSKFLFKSLTWERRAEGTIKPSIYVGYEPERPSSQYIGNDLESQDNTMWSEITDEEFELTQFLGMEIDAKNEELILNINRRIQTAFELLLQTINETANELEHAKATQTELMQESFKWEHEATELTKCQEELQERFDEEVRAREQIARELSTAESLIDCYADEKLFLEKQIQGKTEVIEHLEQELHRTGNKLQELEAERQHLQEEKELLFRQKDAMKADAGPIEQQLLAETEKLMKEKIEVQRQAEKEYNFLQKHVKALESDLEEQLNQFLELDQEKNSEIMDLKQKNQALEKQLEKTKKFLDEQAIDREHERDVFQQEIQKLEQQLKIPQRFQPVSEHQNREVEELTNNLQEKTDKCSELLLSKEQLQRDVQERNEEIEKLECRIQELEQALIISADNIQKVEEKKKFGSATKRGDLPLEAQLQAEQDALDRKEKEIINLEEQLEQFREKLLNKNEEVQQLQMQLQIQLKESTTRQQELEQENKLFKEDMKQLGQAIQNSEDTSIQGHHQVPEKYIEIIQEKEQKIHELHEQISKFQQQMEITTDNKLVEHIKELEAQIEILKSDQERVKQNNEQEIEQLNEVIEKLQHEMGEMEHKILLDSSLTQEDVDNLKHQLDVVLAEREDLVMKLENNVKQLCTAKNELEFEQISMVELKIELDILKEEIEKIRENPELNIKRRQPQDKQIITKIEEDASGTSINFQMVEKALEEKDLELIQSNKDFKDFKDQAHMASNKVEQRIMELEKGLEEKEQKFAALLQHQAELNVVLEQIQCPPLAAVESENNKEEALCIQLENAKYIGREDATTRLLELSEKRSEMQRQLADAQNNLQLERTKVEIVPKETKEKEESVEQLLNEIEQIQKKEKLSSSEENMQTQGLLRAIYHEGTQVLSLTEFLYNEGEVFPINQELVPWLEERKAFLSSILSLKELIAKMQIHRQTKFCVASEASDSVSDWRAELLCAVQQIFQKEKDILLAAVRTELAEAGVQDALGLINQLESRFHEQVTYQRNALDFIQHADRQSLLMEINTLHEQLNRQGEEKEIHPKCQEPLGYNMEMQIELKNTKDRTAELQEQLTSERMVAEELKNELGQTKLELETTLKAQHKHLRDLEAIRNELKGKTIELDILQNTITNERKKSMEFQWALEKEKTKVGHSKKREKQEIEDLKFTFENERQKNIELSKLLELERQLSNDLQKKIESQEALNEEHKFDLQVLLESEKLKVVDLCSALDKEKDLHIQLQMIEQIKQDGSSAHSDELLKDLQKQLNEKHDRIVLMVNELEENRLKCVKLEQLLEKEQQRKTIQDEQDVNILAQQTIHELESPVEELQWQIEEMKQQILKSLGKEEKQQEMVEELQQKMQRKEVGSQVEKATCQAVNEVASEESSERTRKWIFQQKMGAAETKELSYSSLMGIGEEGEGDASRQSEEIEMIRQKINNVSSKLKPLANKAACRLPFEKSDDEDLIGIQHDIEDVLVKLQVLADLYSVEVSSIFPSSASLIEGLLKQYSELNELVKRLGEEKMTMREEIIKLEKELRSYKGKGPCGDSSLHNGRNIDAPITSEKEISHKEKLSLLKNSEIKLTKFKELKNEAFLKELESESENAALKIIYAKYLRAESFRKALIYQKQYLLLLLNGFQQCEEFTATLLARMDRQPPFVQLEAITHHSKSFTRFRSAAIALIAISRMKSLVQKWKRVTAYHLTGINLETSSQNTDNELQSNSFSGSLELCGEHRAASYRSKSELESLRSPSSYQNRYQGAHTDVSPASPASSQLQNYDPDGSLTDYFNRLKSLQRRLGQVQPASASQIQLHSALRR